MWTTLIGSFEFNKIVWNILTVFSAQLHNALKACLKTQLTTEALEKGVKYVQA